MIKSCLNSFIAGFQHFDKNEHLILIIKLAYTGEQIYILKNWRDFVGSCVYIGCPVDK